MDSTVNQYNSKNAWSGHIAMLFANFCWGAMSPLSKNILESGVTDGLTLSVIRIVGATLVFVVAGFFLPESVAPRHEKIERKDWVQIVVASFLMITINQGLYIYGIQFTSPVDASIMSTLTPVFTMICAALIISMPITWLKGLGVALGLGGALMMVLGDQGSTEKAINPMFGNTMCLIAQLCAALYYVLFRNIINRYSPYTLMKWMFIASTVTFGLPLLPRLLSCNFAAFTPAIWWSIAYIIVFATFIGYLLIPFSQRLLKPTVISMYSYFQPVTSAILATVLGLATFGLIKIAATVLIFAVVFAVSSSK
ncbi:MAG: DMT family transporter [Muribaculaceae bacterium]|nr:DMT family transporter [Muribaculaceae bacterium]